MLEPQMSLTGGYADHRHSMRSADIGPFFVEIVKEMINQGLSVDPHVSTFLKACKKK